MLCLPRGVTCLVLALALVCCSAGAARAWQGQVFKVVDGDSLVLRRGKKKVEVRLYGIDAPEYRQRYALLARTTLSRLVSNREVEVERMDVDAYGREVALVRQQGVLINEELVRLGAAWVYPHYCRSEPACSRWRELEQTARRERRGLWRDKSPQPPWEWRHEPRNRRSEVRGRQQYTADARPRSGGRCGLLCQMGLDQGRDIIVGDGFPFQ
ncbi:MAG: hypothetical protein BWK76_12210 [Desulfobulbaceae bacterium A2]|nr:MAG: hypothetical protein BWK76_12210 [Desulfobulbaceae bacterium A2]